MWGSTFRSTQELRPILNKPGLKNYAVRADIIDMRDRFALGATRGLTPMYLCLVVLGSIVAHLASEFFSMGTEAGDIALSPKHLYLGVAALVCAAIALLQARSLLRSSEGARDLKRQLQLGLDVLPFRGRGLAFLALTAGLQLAIGLATQYGEGCPFCGHDVAAGILGALLTVIALALASRFIGARLPSIAAAIAALFIEPAANARTLLSRLDITSPAFFRFIWFSQLYNRPPPSLSI
jgi:hypothetical protein